MKLRYWPEVHPTSDSGEVLDVRWERVKALKRLKINELHIGDTIGGRDNLRIIFYAHDAVFGDDPLRVLWVLLVMQKKRMDFTPANLKTFRARCQLILTRYYGP